MDELTIADVTDILNAGHYIDIRNGQRKPRHKPALGAKPFSVGDASWIVNDEPQLRSALESLRQSENGGTIKLNSMIEVSDTVRLPSRCIFTGGGLVASRDFKQSGSSNTHLLSIRDGAYNVWVHNVLLDGNRYAIGDKSMITLPIREESNNIIISCCGVVKGKSGVVIANGSSNVTVFDTASAWHSHWHGIVVQHIDCESIAILGCNTYENGGYGIDMHVTYAEVAGCLAESNGQTSNHSGVAMKAPESRNLWIHDCDFSNYDSGLPVWRMYGSGDDRAPSDVYLYRCNIFGEVHLGASHGDLMTAQNQYFNTDGNPTSLNSTGNGDIEIDPSLTDADIYPYEIDSSEPTEPKPGQIFTAQQTQEIIRLIQEYAPPEAFQVFQEEIKRVNVEYNPLNEAIE